MIKVLTIPLGVLLVVLLALVIGAGVPLPYSITSTPNTAGLKTLPAASSYGGMVARATDGVANAPPMYFHASALLPNTTPCTLNGGAGDGASQVPTSDGNCWYGYFPSGHYDVREFGALGNGATAASTAIQNAINAASAAGGGTVIVPPTGDAYVINAGLTVPAGVQLQGASSIFWTSPIDNTRTDWTSKGSWFWPQDGSNPGITLNGNNTGVHGINFWYTQTAPGSSSCGAPCTYSSYTEAGITPYTILVNTTANAGIWITDTHIINATNCVDWEGPSDGVTGIYSGMERDSFGCLNTGTKFRRIDNTLMLDDLRYELWWYQGTSQWWWIMQDNGHVDWDIGYLANPQVKNVEFSFGGTAMKFTNETVSSGFGNVTFALSDMQGSNISFNENCTAMTVASASTIASFDLTNVIAYTDSTTSPVSGQCAQAQSNFFNLGSDDVNGTLTNLEGGYMQSLATIGNGTSGQLHLGGKVEVQNFSAYANGAPLVTAAANSDVDFQTTPVAYPSTTFTAGALCSGTGCGLFASTIFGSQEITGASGSTRETCFTNLPTPPGIGTFKGQQVFCVRGADASGNFDLDRYATPGTYSDSPITVNRSTGVVGLPDGISLTGTSVITPSGAGAAANYVCTDSSGKLLVQSSPC